MINCEAELNGQKILVHLALPLTRMAENPNEVYYDDLRIEIAGIGVLRIPLSKIDEVLSTRHQLMPPSSSSKSKNKPAISPARGKLRLIKTRD